jgi:hypothetical protein
VSGVIVPMDLVEGPELVPEVASVPVHADFLAVKLATILRLVFLVAQCSTLALVEVRVGVIGVGELAGHSVLAETCPGEVGADSGLKVCFFRLHFWHKV